MKRLVIFAATLAALAFAASASADVPRYQFQTATFTVTEPAGAVDQWTSVWTHSYTVTVNPCDNTFTGAAPAQTGPGGITEGTGETITGSFSGYGTITFTATRTYDGRTWTLTNVPFDTEVIAVTVPAVAWDIDMKVSEPVFTTTSDYKTHGAYVKAEGGGSEAAHYCIGMPIQDMALTFTATTPEGVADQWTNVWTHTYVIYYNAADHTFTGTGTNVGTLEGLQNTEAISGTLNPTSITFNAHYLTGPYSLSGTPSFDYIWSFSGPFNTETLATSNYQFTPGVFQTLDVKVTEPVSVP
jgi:hypothetical protein